MFDFWPLTSTVHSTARCIWCPVWAAACGPFHSELSRDGLKPTAWEWEDSLLIASLTHLWAGARVGPRAQTPQDTAAAIHMNYFLIACFFGAAYVISVLPGNIAPAMGGGCRAGSAARALLRTASAIRVKGRAILLCANQLPREMVAKEAA